MKKEYDFSKGERGKFYRADAVFHIPVYLKPEIEDFIARLAAQQKTDASDIVNKLLQKDKEIMEMQAV